LIYKQERKTVGGVGIFGKWGEGAHTLSPYIPYIVLTLALPPTIYYFLLLVFLWFVLWVYFLGYTPYIYFFYIYPCKKLSR